MRTGASSLANAASALRTGRPARGRGDRPGSGRKTAPQPGRLIWGSSWPRTATDERQRISDPQVYAAGDGLTGLNQIGVAKAQAEIAAIDIHHDLRRGEQLCLTVLVASGGIRTGIDSAGTVKAQAKEIGEEELARAMQQAVEEGYRLDREMTELAEGGVNPEALQQSGQQSSGQAGSAGPLAFFTRRTAQNARRL